MIPFQYKRVYMSTKNSLNATCKVLEKSMKESENLGEKSLNTYTEGIREQRVSQ